MSNLSIVFRKIFEKIFFSEKISEKSRRHKEKRLKEKRGNKFPYHYLSSRKLTKAGKTATIIENFLTAEKVV